MDLPKVIRYVFSGSTGAATNLTGLFILVHFAHIHYLFASIISFLIALVVGFVMQKFWTFNDHTANRIHTQFVIFTIVATINLCINTLLMYLFVSFFGIWYLFAQVFTSLLIAMESYVVYKKFVFIEVKEGIHLV